jgi:hypothetical protein
MIINIKSSEFLSEIEIGKTYHGIEKIGEKKRQREKGLVRERSSIGGERKVAWVILTVGLRSTPLNF